MGARLSTRRRPRRPRRQQRQQEYEVKAAADDGDQKPTEMTPGGPAPGQVGHQDEGEGAEEGGEAEQQQQQQQGRPAWWAEAQHLRWFHGAVSKPAVLELLREPGDYLLRVSSQLHKSHVLVLSTRVERADEHIYANHRATFVQHLTIVHATAPSGGPGPGRGAKFRFKHSWRQRGQSERWYDSLGALLLSRPNKFVQPVEVQPVEVPHPPQPPGEGASGLMAERNEEFPDVPALPAEAIQLGQRLGEGNFGDVFRATLAPTGAEVAVKMLKPARLGPGRGKLPNLSAAVRRQRQFFQEAATAALFDHPNVIRLVGAVFGPAPRLNSRGQLAASKAKDMIVVQLCPKGELLEYLRAEQRPLATLLQLARDTATGLAHLHSKGCIHRDVAARNCLVDEDGAVRVSDFGLARIVPMGLGEYHDDAYVADASKANMPIKWTAPDALEYGVYKYSSDIWSLGVLLWEIFSGGKKPYAMMTNKEAYEEVLHNGYRLPGPRECPEQIYDLMLQCWHEDEAERPTATDIAEYLDQCVASHSAVAAAAATKEAPPAFSNDPADYKEDEERADQGNPYINTKHLAGPPRSADVAEAPKASKARTMHARAKLGRSPRSADGAEATKARTMHTRAKLGPGVQALVRNLTALSGSGSSVAFA